MNEKWTVEQVFADPTKWHECCTCCAGYCPAQAGDWDEKPPIFRAHIGDREVISDRFTAVFADLIDVGERKIIPAIDLTEGIGALPKTKPPLSEKLLRAAFVDTLAKLGITVHANENGKPQLLYLGDEFVGVLMPIEKAEVPGGVHGYSMRLSELDAVRTYAERLELAHATYGEHPWDMAAYMLGEARRLKDEGVL